jgi:TadE-like protein
MRDCRGNLSIEFAILVPLFLLLAIGIFDTGMVVIEKMKLEFATEAAAKLFVTPDKGVCRTPAATADYAAGLLGISPSNFSVATPCGGQPGGSVTANYTYTAHNPTFDHRSCGERLLSDHGDHAPLSVGSARGSVGLAHRGCVRSGCSQA